MDQRPWKREELRYCIENRGKLTCEQMASHLDRTPNQVRKALQRWGNKLRAAGKTVPDLNFAWTPEELRLLERYRRTMSLSDLANVLHKSYNQVKGAVRRLRLKAQAPGAPKLKRSYAEWIVQCGERFKNLHRRGYSDADIAGLIPGMSIYTARGLRQKLGLPSNIYGERHRRKMARFARENMQFRVTSMLEAERLGWPGRSLGEARTLTALAEAGPLTREELTARLGIKWGSGSTSLSLRVRRLQEAGLITNGDGRYRLAKGVERRASSAEEQEDE
jgi:DNA-binding CsgD family transcriptional regulator